VCDTNTVVNTVRLVAVAGKGAVAPSTPAAPIKGTPAKITPVIGATSVHTGEPWAGTGPYVLFLLALGFGLLAVGEVVRRRRRPESNS
jgi:hypothetical protein